MRVLVTGAAGFIGYHVSARLLADGHTVVGVDNLTPYYPIALKRARLAELERVADARFSFHELDLADRPGCAGLFDQAFDRVLHLAAQAGVRYSIEAPHAYADANLVGFLNVLEGCRRAGTPHLVYASSSSVYGDTSDTPFRTDATADRPVSLYAATKRAGELMAHSYAHLYRLRCTGLRFFTVYGPWGRPDMAYYKFAEAIDDGRPIQVFNHGHLERDFTYIDDIVEGVVRVMDHLPPVDDQPPWRLYNIGAGRPTNLLRFIEAVETAMGREAIKEMVEMQPGDVHVTWADTTDLKRDVGFAPQIDVETGVRHFVDWFRVYRSRKKIAEK